MQKFRQAFFKVNLIHFTVHVGLRYYVYFAGWTDFLVARIIIPHGVVTGPHIHARLVVVRVTRIGWVPEGVVHYRHLLTVRIIECLSPDEWRLTTWVPTLSTEPQRVSVVNGIRAWPQIAHWNTTHDSVLLRVVELTVRTITDKTRSPAVAKKLFNFSYAVWSRTGFWTVKEWIAPLYYM